MLAIARAMVEPRRLLLSTSGQGPRAGDRAELIAALRELKRTETTILWSNKLRDGQASATGSR